jgi:uncharacterized protein (TIGR02569 family)
MPHQPPPQAVLADFGVADMPLERLAGGQGTSWRAGDLVLKPADLQIPELQWLAEVLSTIECDGFRVARPRLAVDGSVCADGWFASEYVAGRHAAGRWSEVIAVGDRFHAALTGVARPAFLDERDSPWAIGDRVAWDELPASQFAQVGHLDRLAAARRPVSAASQLIHGDLGGNVLFHDELPPAIIDFSAYWRPVGFAAAIVVADALVWEGADEGLLDAVSGTDQFGQYIVRALIYRAVTDWLFASAHPAVAGSSEDPWLSAVDLACQLAPS